MWRVIVNFQKPPFYAFLTMYIIKVEKVLYKTNKKLINNKLTSEERKSLDIENCYGLLLLK